MLLAGVKQLLKKMMNSKLSVAKNAYYFLEKECKRIAFFIIAFIIFYVFLYSTTFPLNFKHPLGAGADMNQLELILFFYFLNTFY